MIKELGTTEPFCCIRFQNQTPPYTLCTDAGLTITMFALHAVTRHPVLVKAEIISLHSQVSHPLSQPPLSTDSATAEATHWNSSSLSTRSRLFLPLIRKWQTSERKIDGNSTPIFRWEKKSPDTEWMLIRERGSTPPLAFSSLVNSHVTSDEIQIPRDKPCCCVPSTSEKNIRGQAHASTMLLQNELFNPASNWPGDQIRPRIGQTVAAHPFYTRLK